MFDALEKDHSDQAITVLGLAVLFSSFNSFSSTVTAH